MLFVNRAIINQGSRGSRRGGLKNRKTSRTMNAEEIWCLVTADKLFLTRSFWAGRYLQLVEGGQCGHISSTGGKTIIYHSCMMD